MAFRTLGEVVLAAHRAEQAENDDNRVHPSTGNGAGDGCDGKGDVLPPMWIIQYFIAQRPR